MALIKLPRAHMISFELGSSVECLASEGPADCLGHSGQTGDGRACDSHMASELSTRPAGTLDPLGFLYVLFIPLQPCS